MGLVGLEWGGYWYLFTLGDELGGVELGDDGLEDFVSDGGEDTLVVVETEGLSEWLAGASAGLVPPISCLLFLGE